LAGFKQICRQTWPKILGGILEVWETFPHRRWLDKTVSSLLWGSIVFTAILPVIGCPIDADLEVFYPAFIISD